MRQAGYNARILYVHTARNLRIMNNLTPRQSQVLEIVKQHIERTGYPPTRAEIAKMLGFRSANAAEEHVKALARKGALEVAPGTSRGIRLTEQPGLPVVGRVAAGQPVLAEQHIEDHVDLAADFFRPQASYLLRVRGDSMAGAGILHGDLLAVHKTPEARSGQIIVARVEDEVTVKRLRRTRSQASLTLLPENEDYAPIEVDLRRQSFAVEGLCVGVLRRA